jgi:hypothetical protein
MGTASSTPFEGSLAPEDYGWRAPLRADARESLRRLGLQRAFTPQSDIRIKLDRRKTMKQTRAAWALSGFLLAMVGASPAAVSLRAQTSTRVTPQWNKVIRVSQSTPTLQVVVNPLLERDSPIHDRVFQALKDLKCDDVRYVPWLPYPKLAVAELQSPSGGKTSWNFSLIDPLTLDFLNATHGHSTILNFSTIPEWMFKTKKPVAYPADPGQATWNYEQGTEFRDPTLREVASYYARLVSWYTQGGFTDEYGKRHESGYHYKIAWWEVLNEVDFEHHMSPQTYTRVYDVVTRAIHQVDPQIKFVGMALAAPSVNPNFFEYFLNPKNHRPGAPLDMISYHFYASPSANQPATAWPYTFFAQADGFLNTVRYIEAIRQRLSPHTATDIDELGCILPYDTAAHLVRPIPNSYWNLCGALYAYLYARLAQLGVQVAGESQLVGYPTQFPSVSMVNWNTGQPNARYWVLKLLRSNFGPGDQLVETPGTSPAVYAQGFVTRKRRHKLLLINKRNRPAEILLPDARGAEEQYVDQETAFGPPGAARLAGNSLTLGGFEVAVVTLP